MCSWGDKSEAKIFLFFFLKNPPKQQQQQNQNPWRENQNQLQAMALGDPFTHSYSLEDFSLHKACATGIAHAAENPGMVITNHFPFLGVSGIFHIK